MTLSASFSKDCFLPPFLFRRKKWGQTTFFFSFFARMTALKKKDGEETNISAASEGSTRGQEKRKNAFSPVVRKCVPLPDKFLCPPSPEGENGDGAVRQKRTEEPSRIV